MAYTYDVLRGRYTSVEIGEKPRSAAEAIADASRLTKGEIAPERIRGGSIGSSKLSSDVNTKLNSIVTNPTDGPLTVNGSITVSAVVCGGHQVLPVYLTINGHPYYFLAIDQSYS